MFKLAVNPFQEFRDYVFITIGLLMYTTGFVCFQLPYHIPVGGTTGAGAVIFYASGFPVQYTYLMVNVVLLAIAIKILGIKFCVKTIYAVLMLTVMLTVSQQQFALPNGKFPQLVGDQAFMACIIGAASEGVGLGIVFLNNGSTGGNDIIAAIVNKYRDMTLGQVIMICDLIVISSSWLVFHSWETLIYGYASLIISNLLLDYVMDRARQSVQFLIISKKHEDIATAIASTHRGVTVLDGHGFYTGQDQKVLVVLAKKRESTNIFRMINQIDPRAFVSQSKAIGVFGEGFDKIKVK